MSKRGKRAERELLSPNPERAIEDEIKPSASPKPPTAADVESPHTQPLDAKGATLSFAMIRQAYKMACFALIEPTHLWCSQWAQMEIIRMCGLSSYRYTRVLPVHGSEINLRPPGMSGFLWGAKITPYGPINHNSIFITHHNLPSPERVIAMSAHLFNFSIDGVVEIRQRVVEPMSFDQVKQQVWDLVNTKFGGGGGEVAQMLNSIGIPRP